MGIGYALGNIKLFNFSFGISAVLFVGIFLGSVIKGLELPEFAYSFGLILFVYCVGIQSGPSFFSSFNTTKLLANGMILFLLSAVAVLALLLGKVFSLSAPLVSGLFCGALTNTPALAAAVEALKRMTPADSELAKTILSEPVVGYGIAYPFSVLGTILAFFLISKLWKINYEEEEKTCDSHPKKTILIKNLVMTNPGLVGQLYKDVMHDEKADFTVSRIKRGVAVQVPSGNTTFELEDILVIVGTEKAMLQAKRLFGGKESLQQIELMGEEVRSKRVFVSNKEVVGRPIADLHFPEKFQVTITRIGRGGVDMIAHDNSVLEMGDQVRMVGAKNQLEKGSAFLGNSLKSLTDVDFFSISLGILLGLLVGQIPIPLPTGGVFQLGNAGGPLLVALLLGNIGRTGKLGWTIPQNANHLFRELGIMLFLAGVGIRTGTHFGATVTSPVGIALIVGGIMLTTVVVLAGMFAGRYLLKIPFVATMGLIAGIQTQPACLAYANQQTKSDQANIWYATAYPIATFAKILLAQILLSLSLF